jgi:hypothetical protein
MSVRTEIIVRPEILGDSVLARYFNIAESMYSSVHGGLESFGSLSRNVEAAAYLRREEFSPFWINHPSIDERTRASVVSVERARFLVRTII